MGHVKPTDEQQLRMLTEAVSHCAFIMLELDGTIVGWNPGACAAFGHDADEMFGSHVRSLHVESDVAEGLPEALLREACERGRTEEQGWRLRKDGSRFRSESMYTAVRDEDGELQHLVMAIFDVTERYEAERKLRASEENFRLFVDGVRDYAIVMLAADGTVASWNAGAEAVKGYTEEEIIGAHFSRFYTAEDINRGHPQFELQSAVENGRYEEEGWRVRKDGSRFRAHVVLIALTDSEGELRGFAKTTRDVSERAKLEQQLSFQAMHDPLTGLPNRRLFLERLVGSLSRSRRNERSLAVLFLDIDGFKRVNDSIGHHGGDELLREIGRRLQEAVRPSDSVGRLSGDEFSIVCEDLTDREAMELGQRLLEIVAEPFDPVSPHLAVSASIGVCMSSGHEDPDELLRNADVAMYRAKDAGRGRVELYDTEMRKRIDHALRLECDLRDAVANRAFTVAYQPQVDLASGGLVGVEALARWHHPERGSIPPSVFIPASENTGLILPIGEQVLRLACEQGARWQADHGAQAPTVAVNLSGHQLNRLDVVGLVDDVLGESGLRPDGLHLEVTESVLMTDADQSVDKLKALRELGVQLAIDDFGTGYSSLAYLKRFPVDLLKIDRSFVDGLGDHEDDDTIAAATIGMARALRLITVAEGIERPEQLTSLRALGCDQAQGYYLGRPVDAAVTTQLLETSLRGAA